MTLNRITLDQYLDGQLAPAEAATIDQQLRTDQTAARLLALMQQERALRLAALRGYEPAADQAAALASRWLAEFKDAQTAPLARIGPQVWIKWAGAIAAGLALMIGGFYAGRSSAGTIPTVAVRILAPDLTGQLHEYNSDVSAQKALADFVALQQQKDTIQVADADSIAPHGSF